MLDVFDLQAVLQSYGVRLSMLNRCATGVPAEEVLSLGAALAVDHRGSERMKFKLPERRVPVSFRMPESLKRDLLAVVKLWQLTATARGHDPKLVDMTYVVEQLLEEGVGNVWAEIGRMADLPLEVTPERRYPGMPVGDEEWVKLEKALLKAAKEDLKSRSR